MENEKVRFSTLNELVNDEMFFDKLKYGIKIAKNRPLPPNGMRYVRGGFEYCTKNNIFDAEHFKDEYIKIAEKRSTLPSKVRAFILSICNEATRMTLKHYSIIDTECNK